MWTSFYFEYDHETRAKGSLVPPTRALNLALRVSSSEWTWATWTASAMNDAFWDCSAAAIAGKRTRFNGWRTAGERWTIWSGRAYLGASAESGMRMRVSVPPAERKLMSLLQLCAQLGGWGQSHLHNYPVPLNALGHLLGNPGEESGHTAYQ